MPCPVIHSVATRLLSSRWGLSSRGVLKDR